MLVVGLTGNIGCGKSSLSKIFIDKKIPVIDADIISRKIYDNKELLKDIFLSFGDSVKNEDNTLNRKALGKIVFEDEDKLVRLNSLTHPKIREMILNEINEFRTKDEQIVVLDAALLVEGGYTEIVDKLVVVICDENIQIQRIVKRDNITVDDTINRIKSQMPQDQKARYGDYVIDNSKELKDLVNEGEKLIDLIKEKWCD